MSMSHEYDGQPAAAPAVVDWTRRVEQARSLDRLVDLVRPVAEAVIAAPGRRDLLRGMWAGHAIHPVLTDLPIGCWTSAILLDLLGGEQARPAAHRLVALGLVGALPTAATGLAEWSGTGQREQRVGAVHAAANTVALGLYAASWRARASSRQRLGVLLGLAGGTATAVGGYLGGHLVAVRKVSSRNPAFETDPAGVL